MALQPYTVPRFGGLNLLDDPQEVGPTGAIDLLNVDLDRTGRVRTRAGAAQLDVSGGTSAYESLFVQKQEDGSPRLFVARYSSTTTTLDKLTTATIANVGNWVSGGSTFPEITGYAQIGTASASFSYFATAGVTTLRRYDGASLATSSGAPGYVAVTPWDNRLCQGWYLLAANSPSGANGSKSTVFFSDPGAPDTYTSTNFLLLQPGDGEPITGMATWDNLLFVAKQSTLFVFYGTGVDATGEPIFNYRRIGISGTIPYATGGGSGTSPSSLVVGRDGVYFVTTAGVMRTRGGEPELVSRAMTPIFDGTATSAYRWNTGTLPRLSVTPRRLLMSYQTDDATERVLVYDFRGGFWTLWGFPAAVYGFADLPEQVTAPERTVLIAGDSHVYYLSDSQTTDYGTAIASHTQSGFYEMGLTGADVFTRWSRLWGSGSPTVSVFTNHGSSDSNAGSVTLGTAPAIAEGYHLKSYQGQLFSHKISATSGQWAVNRLQHDIASVRP